MTLRHATALETVQVVVPEAALEAYEAALAQACGTVGFFRDEATGLWTIEGVKDQGVNEAELAAALALAELASGVAVVPRRHATPADDWLARSFESFPEQLAGRRFAIRGTHLSGPRTPGRITIVLDAAIAFGSGEHGSTRGCLRALERVAHRHPTRSGCGAIAPYSVIAGLDPAIQHVAAAWIPGSSLGMTSERTAMIGPPPVQRILDLGTGSGILAMAAAKLLHRRVLATDIDPWSVRVAGENARRNRLAPRLRAVRVDGWSSPALRRGGFSLVFANILARPLCRMAKHLARALAPGGTAILAGLLDTQASWVLAAHRRHGLVLEATLREGPWTTLILRRR